MTERAATLALARLAEATPERPVQLGRFQVVARLGRGGMGTVYEAIDRERGSVVALKTLRVAGAAAAVNLKREFRVVADLAHQNLAPVYELTSVDGVWFFTMERVEGLTLTQWARAMPRLDPHVELPLSRTLSAATASEMTPFSTMSGGTDDSAESTVGDPVQPVAWADAASMPSMPDRDMTDIRRAFADLVSGIGALHDAGLRHSDVKPSNVLVRPNGRVVLVDFGLAQPLITGEEMPHRSGGTPTYMPPEQLCDDRVGPAADWYALGATLYRVLTGCRPFVARSRLELYIKKTKQVPPSPRSLLPDLPADLSDLSMALMDADPKRRPTREDLERVFDEESSSERAPEPVRTTPFVGRDRELCALEHAYGMARSGKLTVVHTHGPSGIGKSALLSNFLSAVQFVDSALVLRGRCYERESVPYKGFDRIVDDIASRLQRMEDDRVEALLPKWTVELARVFPALSSVRAIAVRGGDIHLAGGAIELRRRGRTALAQLLEALRNDRPMVLAIDDLQWADSDSAELLVELLRDVHTPLLVVIPFRPSEATNNPGLEPYFALCEKLAAREQLVDLPLEGLPLADAKRLARAVLGDAATPERVEAVAEEARGVPFFIEELAYSMGERERRGVDADLSLDDAIRARVGALPPAERKLVELMAVANSPLPQSVVFEAAELDPGVLRPLLSLRRASLVSWLGAGPDDPVSVYHDRIREAVLASLSHHDALALHLALGRTLSRRGGALGGRVFDAVRHLRAAAPLLENVEERRRAASLHADAGELARGAAAFQVAYDCFEGGIALLAENAWHDDYELTLRLYGGAVESAYLCANWRALERHSAVVKARSRTLMDQLVAWETEIDAYAGRQRYNKALDAGLSVLSMLGVDLPRDPSEAAVGEAVQATLARLTEIGTDGLRALPDLEDPRAAAATRIQVRLSPAAYFGKPMLLPLIACHLVNTSIDRGVSTATPYALSLFGIVLNTVELYPVSHAWGQLAAELLDRWPDRRLEAATRHILSNLVCCWMVPLKSILGPLREVFDIGCRTGDYEYASYAAHGYIHNAMYAGRPLGQLLEEALSLGEQMRSLGQVNALHVHEPFEQLLKAMTGQLADARSLNDDTFDEAQRLAEMEDSGSRSGVYLMHHIKGMQQFYFGEKAEAFERFEAARGYVDAVPSIWHMPIRHQLGALAACALLEETTDATERERLRERIDEALAALKRLTEHAPVNFAHRVSLIQAEMARLEGRAGEAVEGFERAILEAQSGGWINDVGLANELAARCHTDHEETRRRLRAARTAYAAWGASAKADQISVQIASCS